MLSNVLANTEVAIFRVNMLVAHFLEALHMEGSRRQLGYDRSNWQSGRVGYYPIGDEHVIQENR
jgi:hypothetical protein